MIEYDRFSWWKTTLSWHGTALPRAAGRILVFSGIALLVQVMYECGIAAGVIAEKHFLGFDPTGHAVLGSLIGFLIVFRLNASNSRYWEGRSHWGMIINSSRNLVRYGCEYTDDGELLARLVTGYVITVRRSLRGFRDLEEADLYLPPSVCAHARKFGNPPTGVAAAISEWIGSHAREGHLSDIQVRHMEDLLSRLVDSQGGCEKIQKTPMPFAHVAMIKQLIVVYLLSLPLVLCERCGWWSPVLTAVISVGLLGIEEASVEIEDPFGADVNCLDMEAFTLTIARDAGQLATRAARMRAPDESIASWRLA